MPNTIAKSQLNQLMTATQADLNDVKAPFNINEEQSVVARVNPNGVAAKLVAAIKTLLAQEDYLRLIQLIQTLIASKQERLRQFIEEYKLQEKANAAGYSSELVNQPSVIVQSPTLMELIKRFEEDIKEIEAAIEGLLAALTAMQAQQKVVVGNKIELTQKIQQTQQQSIVLKQQINNISEITSLPYNPEYLQDYLFRNPELAAERPDLVAYVNSVQPAAELPYMAPVMPGIEQPSAPPLYPIEDGAFINASAPYFDIDANDAEGNQLLYPSSVYPGYVTPSAPSMLDDNSDNLDFKEIDQHLAMYMQVENERKVQEQAMKHQLHQVTMECQLYQSQFELAEQQNGFLGKNILMVEELTDSLHLMKKAFIQVRQFSPVNVPNKDQYTESKQPYDYNAYLYNYLRLRDALTPFVNSLSIVPVPAPRSEQEDEAEEQRKKNGNNTPRL